MQELLRHSTIRSTLDVYTQAITPAKQNAQAAVMSLVFPSPVNAEDINNDAGVSQILGANWVQNAPKLHPISLISLRQIIP
jgi:hypothetical protein